MAFIGPARASRRFGAVCFAAVDSAKDAGIRSATRASWPAVEAPGFSEYTSAAREVFADVGDEGGKWMARHCVRWASGRKRTRRKIRRGSRRVRDRRGRGRVRTLSKRRCPYGRYKTGK